MSHPISATCRFCGKKYRLRPSAAGKRARCKKCGEIFRVPPAELSLDDTIAQWLFEDQAKQTREQELADEAPTF